VNAELIELIQQHLARLAIGPSSMRGKGNAGVVRRARGFLAALDVHPFGTARARGFAIALDETTEALRGSFPRGVRLWGLARKGLNIFLRECLYCAYTREHYHLDRSEAYFEIPLDSITTAKLRRLPGADLPPWPGVKYLDAECSAGYQAVAAREAVRRGFSRVHLDALWWGAIDRAKQS
jgi:hypothetical protein